MKFLRSVLGEDNVAGPEKERVGKLDKKLTKGKIMARRLEGKDDGNGKEGMQSMEEFLEGLEKSISNSPDLLVDAGSTGFGEDVE